MKMSIDIETYSDEDIRKTGSYKYALSTAFDILLIAYAVDDNPVQVIDLTEMGTDMDKLLLDEFLDLIYDDTIELWAYNAAFEYWCINVWLKRRGMEPIPVSRYHCTMIHGLYCGYTAGLAVTGEVLGLPQDKQKMSIGTALIRKFCVPAKPTKSDPNRTRIYPHDEPEKWNLFKVYNRQDVEAERTIGKYLEQYPLPDSEQKLWELDITSNSAGVLVDMDLVQGALELNQANTDSLLDEAKRLTGLENPNSVSQLLKWVNENGEETETLRKADVIDILGKGASSDKVQRMLEIRQQLGKTSCKKYDAIVNCACVDGRIRGLTQFYGANRTGRYAGRLIQPQNLPQNHLDDLAYARELVKERDADALKMIYGDSIPDTLSQLIRTTLVPPKGYRYVIADYSAIECRVISFLAGEQWVLDTFVNGGDIYCATASQMFKVPVEKHGVNSHLRQRGKVATLALGYAGGENALIAMGALRMGIPEEDLPEIKQRWRDANPHIVALWKRVGRALDNLMKTGEAQYLYLPGSTERKITFRHEYGCNGQDWMTIELLNGRKLFYAHPHMAKARKFEDQETLHYYQQNQTTRKWEATDTFAGKCVENIVQATARDLLCNTLMELYKAGYIPRFHVHDEVIIEAPEDKADEALKLMLDIMATPPDWAEGLPLRGAGFVADFYQKD